MNPPPPALAHVNEPLSTCANRTASFLAWSVARNSYSYQLSGYIIRAGIISFAFHSAHFPQGKGNEFPSRTRVVVSAMSDRKYVICHAGLAAWQLHPGDSLPTLQHPLPLGSKIMPIQCSFCDKAIARSDTKSCARCK